MFQMTLTAYDKKGRESDANITVRILDVNDHSPRFIKGDKEIELSESAEIGFPVYQVQATDEDIGENGRVSYQYSSTVKNSAKELFSLDSETGQIRLTKKPDFETETIHRLYIEAVDGGNDKKHDYCTVRAQNDKKHSK